VGFTKDVDYDIEFIGGIKNSIFGGEGLFYATPFAALELFTYNLYLQQTR
jgi:hypothetical protein